MLVPGNDLDLGTLCTSGKRLGFSRRDRGRHLFVVGSTRTGKTKALEGLVRQDILAWPSYRCPLVVIDPHGTLYDGLIGFAAAHDLRRWPIIPLDLRRGDVVVAYNLLRRREGADPAVICRGFVEAILHAWGQASSNETPPQHNETDWLSAGTGQPIPGPRQASTLTASHLPPTPRFKLPPPPGGAGLRYLRQGPRPLPPSACAELLLLPPAAAPPIVRKGPSLTQMWAGGSPGRAGGGCSCSGEERIAADSRTGQPIFPGFEPSARRHTRSTGVLARVECFWMR